MNLRPLPEPVRPPLRRAWLAAERRVGRVYSRLSITSQLWRITLLPPTRAEIAESLRLLQTWESDDDDEEITT